MAEAAARRPISREPSAPSKLPACRLFRSVYSQEHYNYLIIEMENMKDVCDAATTGEWDPVPAQYAACARRASVQASAAAARTHAGCYVLGPPPSGLVWVALPLSAPRCMVRVSPRCSKLAGQREAAWCSRTPPAHASPCTPCAPRRGGQRAGQLLHAAERPAGGRRPAGRHGGAGAGDGRAGTTRFPACPLLLLAGCRWISGCPAGRCYRTKRKSSALAATRTFWFLVGSAARCPALGAPGWQPEAHAR